MLLLALLIDLALRSREVAARSLLLVGRRAGALVVLLLRRKLAVCTDVGRRVG